MHQHPANSVWQRHSWKQTTCCSLTADKRQHTSGYNGPIQHGRPPSNYSRACVSMAPARVDLSLARPPPDAIVHPVGSACVTFFYYTLTRSCRLWLRAHRYRSVLTELYKTSESVQTDSLKLQDWRFPARSGVKCIRSSKNISEFSLSNNKTLHRWSQGHQNSGFALPNQTPSSLLNTVDIALQPCNEQCSLWIITPHTRFISKW